MGALRPKASRVAASVKAKRGPKFRFAGDAEGAALFCPFIRLERGDKRATRMGIR